MSKTDFHNNLISFNRKTISSKTKYLKVQKKLNNLTTKKKKKKKKRKKERKKN